MTDKVMRSARTIAAKNRSDHSARIIRRRGEHHRPSTRCRRERDATQTGRPRKAEKWRRTTHRCLISGGSVGGCVRAGSEARRACMSTARCVSYPPILPNFT